MTLSAFAIEIDDLAQARGLIMPWETYYPTAHAWEQQWKDGKSPREALDEDLDNGVTVMQKQVYQHA